MVNWYAITLAVAIIIILPKRYLTNKLLDHYRQRKIKPRKQTVVVILDDIGMNFEKARIHAAYGSKIIIGTKDGNRADSAKKELIQLTKNKNITSHPVDIKSADSIGQFAKQIITNESHVDVLINNEGFDLSDLNLMFAGGGKQELAAERFQNHCRAFLYEGGDAVRNYKLPGWYHQFRF